ncbi:MULTISPECIES: hypothetical protein [Bacteria]
MTDALDRFGACAMVVTVIQQGGLTMAEGAELITALLSVWVRA